MAKKLVTVTITWEIDEGIYLPEEYAPSQKDVDEVTAWLIEDDVEDYLFEMHIENIVRDSMEKLGAKTTESVTWTEWETSNAS
jgi:hypothetical protein